MHTLEMRAKLQMDLIRMQHELIELAKDIKDS